MRREMANGAHIGRMELRRPRGSEPGVASDDPANLGVAAFHQGHRLRFCPTRDSGRGRSRRGCAPAKSYRGLTVTTNPTSADLNPRESTFGRIPADGGGMLTAPSATHLYLTRGRPRAEEDHRGHQDLAELRQTVH